jgi:aryl-alcohol dehydrogenase-like predicted oxidoreductase
MRLGTDRFDLLYQHRVDPDVSIESCSKSAGRAPLSESLRDDPR